MITIVINEDNKSTPPRFPPRIARRCSSLVRTSNLPVNVAKRIDLSRLTVRKIEQGDPTVSIGHYVAVLSVPGLVDDEPAAGIRQHPWLLWNVKHVRAHKGLPPGWWCRQGFVSVGDDGAKINYRLNKIRELEYGAEERT